MLLISAGVLGVLPLSGVVSPFLSSGNTAMLANFADLRAAAFDFGGRTRPKSAASWLRVPLRLVIAAAACVLVDSGRAVPDLEDGDYLARDAHAFELDGVKRPQHNPRMNSLAHEMPRGTFTIATGFRWRPATGRSWSATRRSINRWEWTSSRRARGSTTGTIRSARRWRI